MNPNYKLLVNSGSDYLIEDETGEILDPEIEAIHEEIDNQLGYSNFQDLNEFIKYNEKRQVLIN